MSRPGRRRVLLVVGPDGAGKSAITRAAIDAAIDAGWGVTRIHYRPNRVVRRESTGGADRPHEAPARSSAGALAKLLITYIDWLGFYISAPAGRRLVVVERGWWDQAVDPRRYRIPPRLGKVVERLGRALPPADVCIRIEVDPVLATSRKPEIEPEEFERQTNAWRHLARFTARAVVPVRTDVEFAQTEAAATTVVRSLLSAERLGTRVVPAPPRLQRLAASSPTDRQARLAALRTYRPLTGRARAADGLARVALRRPLASQVPEPALSAVVEGLGIDEVASWASFSGSQDGRRILSVVDAAGAMYVAKVNSVGHDPGLDNEIRWLRFLADAPLTAFRPPALAFAGVVGGFQLHVTRGLSVSSRSWRWSDVVDVCTNLQTLERPIVHGDLTPWNLHATQALVVLDWESCTHAEAPLRDLCHFVVAVGGRLRGLRPREAATLLVRPGGPGALLAARLGLTTKELHAQVLRELHAEPTNVSLTDRFRREVHAIVCA
jgi:hypothetical protein